MSTTQPQIDPQQVQIPATGANTAAVSPLGQSAPPPVAAGQPSVWKDLAMGALWGMVGASKSGALNGRMTGGNAFAAGAAGGAAGVLEEEPQFKAQMAQAAADVKFKSAQAADMQIDYAMKEKALNNLSQEQQDAHAKASLEQLSTLKSMGLTPVAVTGDNPGDAQATGRNLTKTQGGVPPLYTIDIGHQHVSFDLGQVAGSPQGLQLLNRQRVDMGQSELTPQQFASLYPTPALQVSAMHTAMDWAHPVIVDQKSLDDAKARLNTIQGQKNITPEMQQDIDSLQNAIDIGTKSVKEANDAANKQAADKATTVALAQESTPGGQASLQRDQAMAQEAQAQANVLNSNAQMGVFGDKNVDPVSGQPLTAQEGNKRFDDFNTKTLQPLQTGTEKSWQMAESAYDEYKAAGGKLPTGAQSMLLLSQHLSTTFGNVKGSRVTRDMIQEHLHARSVSDSALVAVQKLTNGDQLSPAQWNAFTDLISQSRTFGYQAAIDQARALGIGKTIPSFLPKPDKGGDSLDASTATIYLYAANGNKDAARLAAQQAGWTFPQTK